MTVEAASNYSNTNERPKIITQGEAIENLAVRKVIKQVIEAVEKGKKVIAVITPTGSGKTSIISALMEEGMVHPDHKIGIIQPTQTLTRNYAATHHAITPLKKVVPWSEHGEGYLPKEIVLEDEIATVKFLAKTGVDNKPQLNKNGDPITIKYVEGMGIPDGWELQEYELDISPEKDLKIYEAKQDFNENGKLIGETATGQILPAEKLRQLAFKHQVAFYHRGSPQLKRSADGKIENTAVAMTDGKGANMVLSDPLLSEFNIMVFDELDKSTAYQNQLLAHIKWLQDNNIRETAGLPPIQIIVTSATVSEKITNKYLDAETITLEDNERVNKPNIIKVGGSDLVLTELHTPNWVESSAKVLKKVIESGEAKYGQAVSIFLPKIAEVEDLAEKIAEQIDFNLAEGKKLVVFPFHSKVDPEELEYARTYKASPNEIVIYIATEAMASGITPATVITTSIIAPAVIRNTYNSITGVNTVKEELMSKSVATQMVGRMGRTENSVSLNKEINAYILGNTFENLKNEELNGLERGNIDIVVLATMASLNKLKNQIGNLQTNLDFSIFDINKYPFPIKLEDNKIAQIVEKLKLYGAIDSNLNITELGYYLIDLNLPIESGTLVKEAEKNGIGAEALIIANILSSDKENLFGGIIDNNKSDGNLNLKMQKEKANINKGEVNIETSPMATGLAILSNQRAALPNANNNPKAFEIEQIMDQIYNKDYQDKFLLRNNLKERGIESAELFRQKLLAENSIFILEKCSEFFQNEETVQTWKSHFLEQIQEIDNQLNQINKEYPRSDLIPGLDTYTYLQGLTKSEQNTFIETYNINRKVLSNITENLGERINYFLKSPLKNSELFVQANSDGFSQRSHLIQSISAKLVGPLIASYKNGLCIKLENGRSSYTNPGGGGVEIGKESLAYSSNKNTQPAAFIATSFFQPAASRNTYATDIHPISMDDIRNQPQENFSLKFDVNKIVVDLENGVCRIKQSLYYEGRYLDCDHLNLNESSPDFPEQYYTQFSQEIYSLNSNRDRFGLKEIPEIATTLQALVDFQKYNNKSGGLIKPKIDFVKYFAAQLESNKITTVSQLKKAFEEGKVKPITLPDLIDDEERNNIDETYPDFLPLEETKLEIKYPNSLDINISITLEQVEKFVESGLLPKLTVPEQPTKYIYFEFEHNNYIGWNRVLEKLGDAKRRELVEIAKQNITIDATPIRDIIGFTPEEPKAIDIGFNKYTGEQEKIYSYYFYAYEMVDRVKKVFITRHLFEHIADVNMAKSYIETLKKEALDNVLKDYLQLYIKQNSPKPIDISTQAIPEVQEITLTVPVPNGATVEVAVFAGFDIFLNNEDEYTVKLFTKREDAEKSRSGLVKLQQQNFEEILNSAESRFRNEYVSRELNTSRTQDVPEVKAIKYWENKVTGQQYFLYEAFIVNEAGKYASVLFNTEEDATKARNETLQDAEIKQMQENIYSVIPQNWEETLNNLKASTSDKKSFEISMRKIEYGGLSGQDLVSNLKYVIAMWKYITEQDNEINLKYENTEAEIDRFKSQNARLEGKRYSQYKLKEEAKENLSVTCLYTENGELLARFGLNKPYGREDYDVYFQSWEKEGNNPDGFWDGQGEIGKVYISENKVEMTEEDQFETSGKRMSFSYGTGKYSNNYVANRGRLFYRLVDSDQFVIKPVTEYPVIVVGQSGDEVYVKLVESMINKDGSLKKTNGEVTALPTSATNKPVDQNQLDALATMFGKNKNNKKK
jgi:HrpA-like RNA helicase